MSTTIKNPSYEEWVRLVFDHAIGEEEWYWRKDTVAIELLPSLSIKYMTRLFSDDGRMLGNYSDDQINIGLFFLISNYLSDYPLAFWDLTVPEAERIGCVRAISNVFRNVFARHCSPSLGYLGEVGSPLNGVCYMWWDNLGIGQVPDLLEFAEMDEATLCVLEEILRIDHDACRESALHGLGHREYLYPARVEEIISRFLTEFGDGIRPELRRYAESAAVGGVQ